MVVVSLLILLDLLRCLHLDTEAAAAGHQGIIGGVSCKVTSNMVICVPVPDNDNVILTLDVILLPDLAPEQPDGDTGRDE